MKRIFILVFTAFFMQAAVAQNQLKTVQKPTQQIDRESIVKNQKLNIDKFKSEADAKLKQIETANLNTNTEIKATLSTSISSYIDNTLLRRTFDRSLLPDPTKPYISEVYCPNPAGVKPFGEFLLIGANLLASVGTSAINVKYGTVTVGCEPLYGKSTSERLWVYIRDFSGIINATAATVTVSNNTGISPPANITLLPELVTKRLNLTYFLNQLKSDFRTSYPTVYVTDITQGGSHVFTILYSDMLWVNHSFPYSSNRTTEYRGSDEFFLTTQIKNNWKVKEVIFTDLRSVCGTVDENQHSSFFYESRATTPSLYVRLGFYNNVDLCLQSGYIITYLVEGPKGTNYY